VLSDAIRWIGPPSRLSSGPTPKVSCYQGGLDGPWECWCRVCGRLLPEDEDLDVHERDCGEDTQP
jgi:hypothetical protein